MEPGRELNTCSVPNTTTRRSSFCQTFIPCVGFFFLLSVWCVQIFCGTCAHDRVELCGRRKHTHTHVNPSRHTERRGGGREGKRRRRAGVRVRPAKTTGGADRDGKSKGEKRES